MPDATQRSPSGKWRLRAAECRARAAQLYDEAERHPPGSEQRNRLYARAADMAERAREAVRHAERHETRMAAMMQRQRQLLARNRKASARG